MVKYGETIPGKEEFTSVRIDLGIQKDLKDSEDERKAFNKELKKLKKRINKLKRDRI